MSRAVDAPSPLEDRSEVAVPAAFISRFEYIVKVATAGSAAAYSIVMLAVFAVFVSEVNFTVSVSSATAAASVSDHVADPSAPVVTVAYVFART